MSSPRIKIYLEDMHDGNHLVCNSTVEYWEKLIAPAVKGKHPIDGGTVDTVYLDPLFENGAHKSVRSIPDDAKYVIPLV